MIGKFKKIRKELSVFIIVGILTVTIDFIVYTSFLKLELLNLNNSKAIGFISGTIFSYLANRYWTFNYKGNILNLKVILRFIIVYSISLLVNVKLNEFILLKTDLLSLAFLFATGTSASINFVGMKLIVFNNFRK